MAQPSELEPGLMSWARELFRPKARRPLSVGGRSPFVDEALRRAAVLTDKDGSLFDADA